MPETAAADDQRRHCFVASPTAAIQGHSGNRPQLCKIARQRVMRVCWLHLRTSDPTGCHKIHAGGSKSSKAGCQYRVIRLLPRPARQIDEAAGFGIMTQGRHWRKPANGVLCTTAPSDTGNNCKPEAFRWVKTASSTRSLQISRASINTCIARWLSINDFQPAGRT